MRTLNMPIALSLAVLSILACANGKSAHPVLDPESRDVAFEDSLGKELLDEIFVERYGSISAELSRRETSERPDPAVIEARAFVDAAEEMYLFGRTYIALRLLEKAAALLRPEQR